MFLSELFGVICQRKGVKILPMNFGCNSTYFLSPFRNVKRLYLYFLRLSFLNLVNCYSSSPFTNFSISFHYFVNHFSILSSIIFMLTNKFSTWLTIFSPSKCAFTFSQSIFIVSYIGCTIRNGICFEPMRFPIFYFTFPLRVWW